MSGFGADRFGWTDDALAEVRARRGWTEAAIERLELTFDAATGRVGFPILDATADALGVLHYLPFDEQRNGRRKAEQPAGVPRQLFPPPETIGEGAPELVLTEGEPDQVAVTSAGLTAVAVPGVEGWKAEYAGRFTGRRWTVFVVFDCDTGGRRAAARVAADLVHAGVDARIVDLDPARDDGYDLTDFLLEHGGPRLGPLLELAEPYEPPAAELEHDDRAPPPWQAEPWPTFRDESPEAHTWLVEGLLPAGALAFVAGPPKKGKTWIGLALGLVVVTGRPLLGEYAIETRPVLYVALEGSRTGLRARLGALARGLGANPDDDELAGLHLLYRPRPFNLVDLATAEWLFAEAGRLDAGLVVVDVLRAAARFRENDAEDFARVRDALEPLLDAGRTVLLLHHFGKLTETQKERSPGERMAGTGAMYGALDVGLLITSSSEHARRMRVEVEARDFAAPDALDVVIRGEGSGEHGGFTYTDTATLERDDSAIETVDYVEKAVELFDEKGEWLTGDDLADALELSRRTIEAAIKHDSARRIDLGEAPRVIRWDTKRDGLAPGAESKNAKPWGTPAMLENHREVSVELWTETTETFDPPSLKSRSPRKGGTGTET